LVCDPLEEIGQRKAEVFPELHMRNGALSRPLVDPGVGNPEESRRLFEGEQPMSTRRWNLLDVHTSFFSTL
jgi:hypothetical protein